MTKAIIKRDKSSLTKPQEDQEWVDIVNQLVDELHGHEVPDKVIQAAEHMLAGWPTYKIAKRLGTTTQTIRLWLTKYPAVAVAVETGRAMLARWRMSKLEQQFLTAVEKSQEVLEIELDGTYYDHETGELRDADPKVLPVVAAQARYIIGLFSGQKIDISVTHELGETVMKAKQDALDYIAKKLAEDGDEDEPIEAVYRIIDTKVDNTGPYLDEHGNPPFGELGKLDITFDGILCHICNSRAKDFPKHLGTKHNMTVADYELTFILEDGSIRKAQEEPDELTW